LALQGDDKILVGGSFSLFNSINRPGIVRLNTNGAVDLTFNVGSGANNTVYAIAVQPDGKVLIGGDFTQVNGTPYNRVARLNRNGSLDLTFTNLGTGFNAAVRAILVQSDGRLVVGGSFTSVNGVTRNYLARMNSDGSLDTNFMAGVSGADNTVYALALQPDGKIIAGGDFGQFNGVTRLRLTRLNPDGTTDPTINFGSGADGLINALVLQPDRKIVIGGGFTSYDDHPRLHIARIHGGTIEGPGTLAFSRSEYQVSESGTNAVINVKRRGGTTGTVGVQFATEDATAVGGSDYMGTNGSLSFPNGETFQSFRVPIIDNTVTNEDRYLNLNLSGYSGGATSGPNPSAVLVILNDETAIGFTSDTFNFNKNAVSGNATITIRRTYATNKTISALFSTVPGGTATTGVDYVPTSTVVTFFPGEVLHNVNVPLINNTNIEGNKTVLMSLGNAAAFPSSVTYVDVPAATLTIVDDNFAPGQFLFSAPTYTVNEYETNITITVLRTNGSSGIVSVQYTTIDGTALSGQDYVATNGTLAFADGETSKTFDVPIIPDYIVETNETVLLVLFNPSGGSSLGPLNTATLTIIDNELINGNINFSASNYSAHESNGVATITVVRSLGFSNAVSVSYRTFDLTASNGNEYIGLTNTLVWADDDRAAKTFDIPLITNNIVEGPTIVGLELFAPTGGATLGGRPAATLTILDDDTGPGNVGFTSAAYQVLETSTNAIVTVRRTFGMSGTVAIDCATVLGGTAIAGVDYVSVSTNLVFLDGETNKTFAVRIISSSAVENDKTINLQLSNPTGGANTNGQIVAAVLTIIEDQSQAGSVDISFTGSGANDQIYSIVIATNQQQVADNNKLLVGGDFTLFDGLVRRSLARLKTDGSVDIAFDAGTNVGSSVRVIGSQADGGSIVGGAFTNIAGSALSYLARLQSGGVVATNFLNGMSGADNFVFATALQPDGRLVVGGKFSSISGVSRHFIARLNADGGVDTTFNPSPGPDGQIKTIALQADGKILIGGDFQNVNGLSRRRVARLNSDGGLDSTFNPATAASSTVNAVALQNDGKCIVGGLFTNWNGVNAGRIVRLNPDGTTDTNFVAGTGANEFVSSIAFDANGKILVGGGFTSFNGIPRSGITRLNSDGSVDTTINFGSGANNYVSTIALQSDRKIVIGGAFTLFNGVPRNYIARLNGGENLGSGEFAFSAANYTVGENGGSITIAVLRQIGTSNTVSVNFSTANGTAIAGTHYTATNGTLQFGPGETIRTFTIAVFDDAVTNANRTVRLTLSNPTTGAVLGNPSRATLTILDNDSVLGFAINDFSVSENAGNAIITVQRFGGTLGFASVDYFTSDGTALAGIKYSNVFGTLFFLPGQAFQTFTVPIINETNVEGNQTVHLTLINPTGTAVLGASTATLTIVDDDFSPGLIGFSQTDFPISKLAGSAVVTVIRSPGSSGSASVQFFTQDGNGIDGFDYIGTNGTLAFAEGEFTKTFSVPIIDDHLVEGPETVFLTLFNPIGATLGQANATLTILTDESGFTFSSPTYSVAENGIGIFINVLRLGKTNGPASVRFNTSDGTATAGSDYEFKTVVLNFADGETNQTVGVNIIDDNIGEGNETVILHLSNPTNGLSLSTAVLTIIDNENTFSFDLPTYSVNEGGTNITINVSRQGFLTNLVTIQYATINGTATAGLDYSNVSGMLVFDPNDPFNFSKSITIPIIEDSIPEGDETFIVQLSGITGGGTLISPSNAVVTILDNDAGMRFSSATYQVNESATNAVISVDRIGALSVPLSVQYATIDGTATGGLDYSNVSAVLVFGPGVTNRTFNVPIIDDFLIEGNETVLLRLFNATPTNVISLVNPTNAILTIIDNDSSTIVPSGSIITAETIPNGVLDPNEAVSVSFGMRNVGTIPTANLVATLLVTNGVVSPSGAASYGVLLPNGPTVSRTFNFTAAGTNGGLVTATFHLQDGGNDLGIISYVFTIQRARFIFTNSAGILINDFANATPYPSTIVVSNVPGTVTNVTVTLYNLAHTYPADIDMLLAGPRTNSAGLQTNGLIIMSDVGGFQGPISNINLTFDDHGATRLTATDPIVSGTYLPSPVGPDSFDPPAPSAPYMTRLLDLAVGGNPNGPWSLFVVDDASLDSGFIAGGWSLTVETISAGIPSADLSLASLATPPPILVNETNHYLFAITNYGPAVATGVYLTNYMPAGATFLSCSFPATVNSNRVACNIGTLAVGAGTVISLDIQAGLAGIATNIAVVASSKPDLNSLNNSNLITTVVSAPVAPPALLSAPAIGSGPFRFTVGGNIGDTFVIEAAADPVGPWTPIATNTLTGASWLYQDVNSGSYNRRFYRARSR